MTVLGAEAGDSIRHITCQKVQCNWTRRPMRCTLHVAGVAQHAQGDLDAALQSFERASQLAEQAIAASSDVTGISGEGAALHSRPDEAVQKDREAGGRASTQAANRTLVRALMSQASILKRLRRLEEALLVARQAAVLDAAVQVHVRELEHELAEKKAPQ